ncbi:MAG: YncE family protein [Verrucomicrobia bacterium]|nr:YncE family protein [Verrucomicrobiota bacterium]
MKRTLLVFLLAICSAWAEPFVEKVYVANYLGNFISILDVESNTILGYVDNNGFDITHPIHLLITPDAKKCYIVADFSDAVYIIDTAQDKIVGSLNTNGFPFYFPQAMLIPLQGQRGYVNNQNAPGGGSVSIFDITTDTVIGYVNTNGFPFDVPTEMEINPSDEKIYVTNFNGAGSGNVSIIDVATETVTGYVNDPFNLISNPTHISFISDTKSYVVDYGGNSVTIIDTQADMVTANVDDSSFPFDGPYKCFERFPADIVLVGNLNSDKVSVIDADTDTVIQYVTGTFSEPTGIHFDDDEDVAYIANYGSNTLSIVDLQTLMEIPPPIDGLPDFPFLTPVDLEEVVSIALPPASLVGKAMRDTFSSQVDLINRISWQSNDPLSNIESYQIYRDAALTDLIGTVPSGGNLLYDDHNRTPGSVSTYYVVSVSENGVVSDFAFVSVSQ